MIEKRYPRTPAAAEQAVTQLEDKFHDYEFPKVSVIIPMYNCASTIPITMEHLLMQDYPDFEIIVIDAGSTDRSMEIIQGLHEDKIRFYTVTGYQSYEMLNKGISQATGQYLNFLFPGDYYLYKDTLKYMMGLALEHQKPHLVYCGTLVRETREEVKALFRHLSKRLLKRGEQPTNLQSCWFHENTFHELGKFNTSYTTRGGLEFLCRFCVHGQLRAISTKRILIDYDTRTMNQELIVPHFRETFKTIYKYFGLIPAIHWLFIQKDWIRFMKLLWRKIKAAFGQ